MSSRAKESFQCKEHKGDSEIWVRAVALYSHAAQIPLPQIPSHKYIIFINDVQIQTYFTSYYKWVNTNSIHYINVI